MRLKIGSRGSQLALKQTRIAIDRIKQHFPDIETEIVVIKTSGDKFLDQSLALIGGKGLFLAEIQNAMLAGEIDLAVHSYKDVPAFSPDGLIIDCVLEREDPRDALVSIKHDNINELPTNAVVGTSSTRRTYQILEMRPDIQIKTLRGNINTRLAKLEAGEYDAIIVAYAGLLRLGLENRASYVFSTQEMIPAITQGIICIERRIDDSQTAKICAAINDKKTFELAQVERHFMTEMSGSCTTPLAAFCERQGNGNITLSTYYFDNWLNKSCTFNLSGLLRDGLKLAEEAAKLSKSNS